MYTIRTNFSVADPGNRIRREVKTCPILLRNEIPTGLIPCYGLVKRKIPTLTGNWWSSLENVGETPKWKMVQKTTAGAKNHPKITFWSRRLSETCRIDFISYQNVIRVISIDSERFRTIRQLLVLKIMIFRSRHQAWLCTKKWPITTSDP